jgi:nucleoporin GLE1
MFYHVYLTISQTERIASTLKDAMAIPSPPVDLRDYFAVPPSEWQTPEDSQFPSLLVYVLNIFSKAIISQFGGESGISIKAAEPAGVLVAQIFAATEFQFKGHSLIDILLAKLHFSCPVLWGVCGDEKTPEGRLRLGWRREDGAFVTEARHHERVSGFGAGFASISLRNFTKSRSRNPFPPTHFWECLANILNVPPSEVQLTHLFVLKAMLENSAERFIQFFGSAAVAALRLALVDFPATLPPSLQATAACKAISVLVDVFARDKNFRIS